MASSGVLRPPSVQLKHDQLLAAINQRKLRVYPHNDDAQHPCTLHIRGHAALHHFPSRLSSSLSHRGGDAQHSALPHSSARDEAVQTDSRDPPRLSSPVHPAPLRDSTDAASPNAAASPASTGGHAEVAPPIPTSVTPTPLRSTIASYIHRFRTQPPLDASERALHLLQHPRPQRDFWWLHKAEGQPQAEREEKQPPEQRSAGEGRGEAGGAADAMTAIRTTLLPAIERMLKEEGKRIAEQLSSSSQHSRPASQTAEDGLESAPRMIAQPSTASISPISSRSLSSRPASGGEASAEPSTASEQSAINMLRLAQELRLQGLASLSVREAAGAALHAQPLASFASSTDAPFPSSSSLLSAVPPSSPYASPSFHPALTSSAALSSLSSLSSQHPHAADAEVDVDDLLAQWRRGRRRNDGWMAADDLRDADPLRTQLEGRDFSQGEGRGGWRVQGEKANPSAPLGRGNVDEEELVERVLQRIRAAEQVGAKRPSTAPEQPLQPAQTRDDDCEQASVPLHIEVQPPPEPLSVAAIIPPLPTSTQTSKFEQQSQAVDRGDQRERSSLRVDTVRDGQLPHRLSASAAPPASSLKSRRRQLSLQLPPHPPRARPRGSSQPSSPSALPTSIARPPGPLLRPVESTWIEPLPRAVPIASTQRASSVPVPTHPLQESQPLMERSNGGALTSASTASALTSPSSGAISSVVARALSCPVEAFARGVHTALGVHDNPTAETEHAGARMSLQELEDEKVEDAAAPVTTQQATQPVVQHDVGALQSTTSPPTHTSAPSMTIPMPLLFSMQPTAAVAASSLPLSRPSSAALAVHSAAASQPSLSASASSSSGVVSLIPSPAVPSSVFLPYPVAAMSSFVLSATQSQPISHPHLISLPASSSSSSAPSAAPQWFVPVLVAVPAPAASVLSASDLRPAVESPLAVPSTSASAASAPAASTSTIEHAPPSSSPPPIKDVSSPAPPPPTRVTAEAAEDELAALLVEMDAPLEVFEDDPALQSLLHKVRDRLRRGQRPPRLPPDCSISNR